MGFMWRNKAAPSETRITCNFTSAIPTNLKNKGIVKASKEKIKNKLLHILFLDKKLIDNKAVNPPKPNCQIRVGKRKKAGFAPPILWRNIQVAKLIIVIEATK